MRVTVLTGTRAILSSEFFSLISGYFPFSPKQKNPLRCGFLLAERLGVLGRRWRPRDPPGKGLKQNPRTACFRFSFFRNPENKFSGFFKTKNAADAADFVCGETGT